MLYKCTTTCWHGGTLWRIGEIYNVDEADLPKDEDGKTIFFERVTSEEVADEFVKAKKGKT